MSRRLLAGLAAAALLAGPLPALAQRTVTFSYNQLGLDTVATEVTDLGVDATNRVWVTTDGGVSAVSGGSRAQFFPFRAARDGLLDDKVRAVTFGRVGAEENFFLGFARGIQWGRIANGLDLRGDLEFAPDTDFRNAVNELASSGSSTVWAATAGGLVEWDITGQAPSEGDTFALGATSHVAVAPWPNDPAALAASGPRLHLVRTGSNLLDTLADDIQDLAFDAAGNLLVLTNRVGGNGGDIIRYTPPTTPAGNPTRLSPDVRFNPSQRTVSSLAVDFLRGTVWIGTNQGAYFQEPSGGTLSDTLCAPDDFSGEGCWALDNTPNFTRTDRIDEILVDPSGNAWFGTSQGLKGRIVRLLTLNSSQYLGEGATATATLEDLPTFAGNGNDSATSAGPDTATIQVAAGSGTEELTAVEQPGDTGRFIFTFRLADIGTVPSADGTDVTVEYVFEDANQVERTLTASARWANIVDFEDDAWIGGPCFLEALGR